MECYMEINYLVLCLCIIILVLDFYIKKNNKSSNSYFEVLCLNI